MKILPAQEKLCKVCPSIKEEAKSDPDSTSGMMMGFKTIVN
jgi:hypothetical protein